MRHHLPVLATGVIGIGLWLLVAPATVGAPTESPEAVIHILALLGGPLLLGWAGAIWLSPRTFWPSLVMVVIPGPVVVMAGGEIVSRLTDNFGRNGWEVYENQEEPHAGGKG